MRKLVAPLLFICSLAMAGCSGAPTSQALKGAAELAEAIASTPLPPGVAETPTGQAIGYWAAYAAGLSKALGQ
jgi:hypothetical protein